MNLSVLWNPGDQVLIWGMNILLQVTVITAIALAAAKCARRDPATRYWILSSSLFLVLLTPSTALVMQLKGYSFLSLSMMQDSVTPMVDLPENRRPFATAKARSSWHDNVLSAPNLVSPSRESARGSFASNQSGNPAQHRSESGPGVDGNGGFFAPEPVATSERDSAASVSTFESPQRMSTRSGKILRMGMAPLMFIWFMGTVFLLARLIINLYQLAAILRSAKPTTRAPFAQFAEEMVRRSHVQQIPELVLSDRVSSPVSAGLLRPRVILPEWLVDQVSDEQLRDIVVHELAHIERRDQEIVLLQHLVAAFFWLHPTARILNRELAKAREEVCDNYVLAITNAPSYSRTLLALAALVTPRPLPGAAGLFTSGWKLEHRVAGLLDEQRNRVVELRSRTKLLIATLSLVVAMVAALGTVTLAARQDSDESAPSELAASEKASSNTNENALLRGPTCRGEGENREMLLRGRVLDVDGKIARRFELVARKYKSYLGRDVVPAKVDGGEFEVWVPISGSHWFYVELAATAEDGSKRVSQGIGNRELRQAAIEGIELRLASTNRTVEISVMHKGEPIANAHVNAELEGNTLLQSTTDATGKSTFRLTEDEKLSQLTAWTDDFRLGGYQFNRQPRRDPLGTKFTIELDNCRVQTIRFRDAQDDSPVANVPFDLVIGTGKPNYNFAAVPDTFPHCRMTTDEEGEATCRWFPDWKTHGAYVEIIDPQWATAVEKHDLTTGNDGALVMTLKRRVSRKPMVGKVTSDRVDVGGLLVEIKSFQGEEEGHSDHLYSFTDKAGNFQADCIPGATYCVAVNDGQLQSNMIDLITYELDTGKSNLAELKVAEGNLIEIRLTSGPRNEPMRNQSVYVRQEHPYTWIEDGERKSGTGSRDYPVFTDNQGVARARALAGSELRVTIYAGDWRSGDRKVTVKDDGVTLIEFHREIDEEREVKGRLLAPPNLDVDLAVAQMVFGSIDGETEERQEITADATGRFAFKTKAIQLGIFAYTTDGKAAGVAKPETLSGLIELQLKPTMDLHGQLLSKNEEPLAHHAVRVEPRVSGKRDFNKSFATTFQTKLFETTTDQGGNYTLKNLPSELDMTLRADSIDDSKNDTYLDDFYLVVGKERPRMVSRLDRAREPDRRTLSEKHDSTVRAAKLDNYHVLVLRYDSTSTDFVKTKLLDADATREVMSFLNLHIEGDSLTKDADRKFAELKHWPQPTQGKVFACALDATGKEVGRIELVPSNADVLSQAADFIRKHAPPQADATAKWDAAFAEAKRSGRRVWARIGQRYCEPCFRLSRWLDDNHELLERDYVLLKIDNVRDKQVVKVANRIVSNREHYSIPFHTIFDANERRLIDSESPVGNIGHPSSFEGRRHLTKMLRETRRNFTEAEIEQLIKTLKD